jgi:hypothetical protein
VRYLLVGLGEQEEKWRSTVGIAELVGVVGVGMPSLCLRWVSWNCGIVGWPALSGEV